MPGIKYFLVDVWIFDNEILFWKICVVVARQRFKFKCIRVTSQRLSMVMVKKLEK